MILLQPAEREILAPKFFLNSTQQIKAPRLKSFNSRIDPELKVFVFIKKPDFIPFTAMIYDKNPFL